MKLSPCEILQQAQALACTLSKAPQPVIQKQQLTGPMLPVSINGLEAKDKERAHLLFKLGDPNWADAKTVANKVSWTLGLQEKDERLVEEEMNKLLKVFGRYAPASGPRTDKRVRLQIYLRQGEQVLRDEAQFDVSPSQRSCLAQTAQQYAAAVVGELGLDVAAWYAPLVMHVAGLLAEATQDLNTNPGEVALLPPLDPGQLVGVRQEGREGRFPRIEPARPELDAQEAERNRRRDEKLHGRGKAKAEGLTAHVEGHTPHAVVPPPLRL